MGKPHLETGVNISHPASADEEGGKDTKNHQMTKGPPPWGSPLGRINRARWGHYIVWEKSEFQSLSPWPCIR